MYLIDAKERNRMKRGFTLVEIVIVVALVVILSTITSVNIMRSRVVAFEGIAIANIRILSNACQMYHLDSGSFPLAISDLNISNPPYVDASLASGSKQRYKFTYVRVSADSFTLNADPMSTGLLKGRYFYTDESSIVRYNATQQAGPTDQIVE